MQFFKHLPNAPIAAQEVAELLREHVVGRDAVPRLAGQLVLRIARRRNVAEVDLGHVANFVVVVEHHPPVARHAEVLEQHVAGEDIGGGQLLDGIAVLFDRIAHLLVVGLLQIQVQRRHAPFHIQMFDHDAIAEIFQLARHFTLQLRQQRRAEARLVDDEILVLLGIRHAPDAVMLFHQLIAGHHLCLRHLFLRGEFVFNHFKHPIEGWQGEHQHHHALHPRRDNELLLRLRHKGQVFAIAFGFAVLLAADRHVQLGGGFARQDLAQPLHHRRRQRRIDHKIRSGEAEDDAGLGLTGQAGVDKQRARLAVVDRQQERINAVGQTQLADQPGGLVAIEQFVGDLEGCPRQLLCAEGALQRLSDVVNIARQILPRQPQRQIAQHAAQHRRQIAIGGEIARQRTRNVAKAPLRLRTEHEQLVRRQIAVLEQPAVDRVKEAFGDLEARVVRQQVDIDCFDPAGEVSVEVFLPGDAFELLHHQADVMVIQMDALFHRPLHRRPVRLLEALLRAGGHFQKAAVLRIEALQDRLCDQQLQFCRHPYPRQKKKPAHAGSG